MQDRSGAKAIEGRPFGSWDSIYRRFARWSEAGIWRGRAGRVVVLEFR
ncbi:hypothetical protein B7R77_12340 [Ralstonia solanacearum K60]|uniref:Transposase n=1 Tax=Ralstonia solanacearum K60 TaxID=1091042 RepID=A0AAP8D4Q9_RALSL|nr:hypothetical protein B7R77_12340 [Ralstonia solanacearum K60]